MEPIRKVMIKQFDTVSNTVLDEFVAVICNDTTVTDDVKEMIKTKLTEFKVALKDTIKTSSKKKNKTKGTRKPTVYNMFMKEKMLELKNSSPELSNNDKFSKIATMWKEQKDTYTPKPVEA